MRLAKDKVQVSNLRNLAACVEFAEDNELTSLLSAINEGRLAPTEYANRLSIYNKAKDGKTFDQFLTEMNGFIAQLVPGTVITTRVFDGEKGETVDNKPFEAFRYATPAVELTPEQRAAVEAEKVILATKVAAEEKLKLTSGNYTKAYEALSKTIGNISPDNRKQFSDLLAGIKSPTDGSTPETILSAYEVASNEVAALNQTVNEWLNDQRKIAEAQAMQAGLDKQATGQAAVEASKQATSSVQGTPTSNVPALEPIAGNDASNSNHGDTEVASKEVLIARLVTTIQNGIQSCLGCKARNETVRLQMIISALTGLQSKVNVFVGKLGL